ncbi:hypothetical protein ACS0TY_014264 [Phlomoides rotata]
MFYLSYSILFDSTRAFLTAQLKSSLLVLVRQLMSILFDSTRAFLTAQLKSSFLVLVLQLMRGMKGKTRGPSPDTEGLFVFRLLSLCENVSGLTPQGLRSTPTSVTIKEQQHVFIKSDPALSGLTPQGLRSTPTSVTIKEQQHVFIKSDPALVIVDMFVRFF